MTDAVERLKSALADRYTIDRELGSGGMATVYLAEDLKLHRKVALKVLRPELASALGPDRFLQEIDIAAKLTHPHILGLHDCGEADAFLYYVMPYVEGQSLREKLAKEGELPIAEAVRILRDVVDALSHAHKHNVVHRDIKPDNVMLTERHALVTDFGVAKAVSDATGAIGLTTEGVALGTPAYMAPEQAAADPYIDHRADIYAVGVIAYELLTGRTPFVGNTQQELLAAHVTQTPEPVTKYRESVPPALADLVMKCLEKKAADRWQTAEELLPQLEALATPSGGVTPTGMVPVEAARRGRKLAATAGLIAAVLAVILVVTLLPSGSSFALDPNHVVVAVFRNETGDPSLDHIGPRTGHWITQGLHQAAIAVTPWDIALQSWEYVETEAEAGRIRDRVRGLAEETGAGVVISGAVYPDGDSIEIQVNVTDAERGRLIGTVEPLMGTRTSAREIIADVQQRVVGFLAVRFGERVRGVILNGGQHVPSLEAYQAFNEGLRLHFRTEYAEAIPHFRRAAELDTTWAQPLIRMGWSLGNLGRRSEWDSVVTVLEGFGDRLSPYDRMEVESHRAAFEGDGERRLRVLRWASELAPGSPSVYNRALVASSLNRRREAVEALSTLNPERGWVREWALYWRILTEALLALDERERALQSAQQCEHQHPDSWVCLILQAPTLAAAVRIEELHSVLDKVDRSDRPQRILRTLVRAVEVLRADGHVQEAAQFLDRMIEWLEAKLANEAAEVEYREWYGRALFLAGRVEEAREIYDGLIEELPNSLDYQSMDRRACRAFIAVTQGDTAQALRDAAWFENIEPPDAGTWRGRVVIAGVIGDHEQVTRLLQQDGFRWYNWWYDRVDTLLEPLRDHPEFQELMRPKG